MVDSSIRELAGYGRDYWHRLWLLVECLPVPLELLSDLGKGVFGPGPVELVQDHDVREVQCCQLLELAGGPILPGGDVYE